MRLLVAPLEALIDPRLTDAERRVLLALYSFASKEENTVYPGRSALGARALMSDLDRVSKLTTSLGEKGWLSKRKVGFSGRTKYCLVVPDIESMPSPDTSLETGARYQLRNWRQIPASKLAPDTSPKLAPDTSFELVSDTSCNELTNEHTNEQVNHSCANAHVSTFPRSGGRSTAAPRCPHREIIALYHETLPELPQVLAERWTGQREKDLAARWRDSPKHQELEFWRWYFHQVRKSKWHMGENDRGWRADLGWLLKRKNFDKVLESAVSAQRRRSS